jgi:hypothetical protein
MGRVRHMTVRDMGMVSGFLVIARFVVFRSHLMMVGGVLMVLGGFPMMFGGLLGHLRLLLGLEFFGFRPV